MFNLNFFKRQTEDLKGQAGDKYVNVRWEEKTMTKPKNKYKYRITDFNDWDIDKDDRCKQEKITIQKFKVTMETDDRISFINSFGYEERYQMKTTDSHQQLWFDSLEEAKIYISWYAGECIKENKEDIKRIKRRNKHLTALTLAPPHGE